MGLCRIRLGPEKCITNTPVFELQTGSIMTGPGDLRMSSELLIGVALSIPIGIACGLTVAPVQRWLDRWGETSHQKKHSRIKSEYRLVMDSALHPDMMIAGMVVNVMYISAYGFFFLVLRFLDPVVEKLLGFFPNPKINAPHFLLLDLVILVGCTCIATVYVFRLVINSVRLYLHVRFFDGYVKSIPDELRDLKMEKIVIYSALDRAVPSVNFLGSQDLDLTEGSKQDGVPAAQNTATHTLPEPAAPQK